MDDASRERNQIRAIAEELELDFRIGENRRLHGGAYGNAVLTRLPIVAHHNHDITWGKYEPRGCLQVTISSGEAQHAAPQLLQIYNVHLGTGYFERRHQASRLLDVLGGQKEAPSRIVLGDFNEWTRGLTSRLLSQHFSSAEPRRRLGRARSYPGVLPFFHLDHIYYDSALELINIKLHRSRLALVASDHLPLVADFRLP